MKLKPLMVAATIAFAPTLALAQSCDHGKKTASSCIQGSVWETQAEACVAAVSGPPQKPIGWSVNPA